MQKKTFCRVTLLIGLGVSSLLTGLNSAGLQSKQNSFHWDWRGWQELNANESLRKAKLGETSRAEIAAAIADQIRPYMNDLEIPSERELAKAALDTRVKLIDLNSDNVPEVVAQGMVNCGATGNCPFWIFQKTGKHYELLLDGFGQTFTVQGHKTNGYNDIVVSMHDSATRSDLTEYSYEAGYYVRGGCYLAEWEILEGSEVHQLEEPRVTPSHCND